MFPRKETKGQRKVGKMCFDLFVEDDSDEDHSDKAERREVF